LKPILLRRTRGAVMKDLPPRTNEIVRIAPTAEQLGIDGVQMQKEVALASGIEELKRRLEVLLGANPHAAVGDTEKQRQQQETERLARRARVAEAGGQLLTAAFTLLGEMIPQHEPTNGAAHLAGELKARLEECLERDEQGRPRLTVTLPNEAVLENLARSVASLLTVRAR
jgi:hypothetical protein